MLLCLQGALGVLIFSCFPLHVLLRPPPPPRAGTSCRRPPPPPTSSSPSPSPSSSPSFFPSSSFMQISTSCSVITLQRVITHNYGVLATLAAATVPVPAGCGGWGVGAGLRHAHPPGWQELLRGGAWRQVSLASLAPGQPRLLLPTPPHCLGRTTFGGLAFAFEGLQSVARRLA